MCSADRLGVAVRLQVLELRCRWRESPCSYGQAGGKTTCFEAVWDGWWEWWRARWASRARPRSPPTVSLSQPEPTAEPLPAPLDAARAGPPCYPGRSPSPGHAEKTSWRSIITFCINYRTYLLACAFFVLLFTIWRLLPPCWKVVFESNQDLL